MPAGDLKARDKVLAVRATGGTRFHGLDVEPSARRATRTTARWVALVAEERELALEDTRTLLSIVALLPQSPELMTALRARVRGQ